MYRAKKGGRNRYELFSGQSGPWGDPVFDAVRTIETV
jgi:hypothetical protein